LSCATSYSTFAGNYSVCECCFCTEETFSVVDIDTNGQLLVGGSC